jgi:hypothetical protein
MPTLSPPEAALHRIILIQNNARADRLHITSQYRFHFLAVIHIVNSERASREKCALLNAVCKIYTRTWQDFQRPVGEIVLGLASAVRAPKNAWLMKYDQREVEPIFSKYAGPQFTTKDNKGWLAQLMRHPGPDRLARCTGFLVAHMDFWLHPVQFPRALHPHRVWRLGAGIPRPSHKDHKLCIRALSDGVQVRGSQPSGGEVVRLLHRGDTEPVKGGLSGIRGISVKLNPATRAPMVALRNHTTVALRDGWVSQPLMRSSETPSFEVGGFYYEGYCMNSSEAWADTGFQWGFNTRTLGLQANRHFRLSRPEWVRFQETICAGWSDLYHVPVGLAADFIELMQLFLGHRVFHEVAVPTILNVLSNGSAAGEMDVISDCFGCCCCDLPESVDAWGVVNQFRCGHRLDLNDPQQAAALDQLLNTSKRWQRRQPDLASL